MEELVEIEQILKHFGLNFHKAEEYYKVSCPFASEPGSPHKGSDEVASMALYEKSSRVKCFGCHYSASLVDFFQHYSDLTGKEGDFSRLIFNNFTNFDEKNFEENHELDESILDIFEKPECV